MKVEKKNREKSEKKRFFGKFKKGMGVVMVQGKQQLKLERNLHKGFRDNCDTNDRLMDEGQTNLIS